MPRLPHAVSVQHRSWTGARPSFAWRAAVLALLLIVGRIALAQTASTAGSADVPASGAQLAAAERLARPVFARECSRCHGPDGRGTRRLGAPNLVDSVWLWDDGTADTPLAALEDTLRYGIRSGHPRARNVGVMPAFGQGGELALRPEEISDLVEYVLALSGEAADPAARKRGRALFKGKGNCAECHGEDGAGNPDWGAADLRVREDSAWLYGKDRASLLRTISAGRGGSCPAWIDRLDPATIHALALWLRSGDARPGP